MKMMKNWKRFWTLDRHHAAGFTLVELIVVIAILAILAGVAVPAYSGYIAEANKTADIGLIADIEKALTLAMYNDVLSGTSIIVVDTNGITVNGAALDPTSDVYMALTSSFGGDLSTIALKYDGWKIASHINGLNSSDATVLKESSFLSGERADNLLQDVEKFTTMAGNLATAMGSSVSDTSLGSMYGDELLDETAVKYGIEKPAGMDWDTWGQQNPQEFSNMLVLATALDNQKYMDEIAKENYEAERSEATVLIENFSSYYAFAATCPEFSAVLDDYLDVMNGGTEKEINGVVVKPVTDPSSGNVWYTQLREEAGKYTNSAGQTYSAYTTPDEFGDSNASNDQAAFAVIMSALSNASKEDIGNNLGDANLFTEGAVKDMYDQYLDAVDSMAGTQGLDLEASDGIAIIYNAESYRVSNTSGQ